MEGQGARRLENAATGVGSLGFNRIEPGLWLLYQRLCVVHSGATADPPLSRCAVWVVQSNSTTFHLQNPTARPYATGSGLVIQALARCQRAFKRSAACRLKARCTSCGRLERRANTATPRTLNSRITARTVSSVQPNTWAIAGARSPPLLANTIWLRRNTQADAAPPPALAVRLPSILVQIVAVSCPLSLTRPLVSITCSELALTTLAAPVPIRVWLSLKPACLRGVW